MLEAFLADGRKVELHEDGRWNLGEATPVDVDGRQTLDFRQVSWGWTQAQVLAAESGQPETVSDSMIIYRGQIAGLIARIVYLFVGSTLTRAKYIIDQKHSNDNDYLVDGQRLRDLLTKKYGQPTADDTLWLGDLYRDDPTGWGMALCTGDLKRYTTWETLETTIFLALSGENFDVDLQLEYTSKQFGDIEAQATESSYLADL